MIMSDTKNLERTLTVSWEDPEVILNRIIGNTGGMTMMNREESIEKIHMYKPNWALLLLPAYCFL